MKLKLYHYIILILILGLILYKTKETLLAATSPATTMLLKTRYLPMRNNFVPMGRPLWVN
jgi:hypothetical protein